MTTVIKIIPFGDIMGFGSNEQKKQVKPAPTKTVDAKTQDYKENANRKKTINTLNAIKIMSPIIEALANSQQDQRELAGDFFVLTKTTSELARKICFDIGADPDKEGNLWALNMVEKTISECLKQQYIKFNGVINDKIINNAIHLVIENTDMSNIAKSEFTNTNEIVSVQVALIKATSIILSSFETSFNFNREAEKETDIIMSGIIQKIKLVEDFLCPTEATSHDRAYIKSSIIIEAANIYNAVHVAESIRVLSMLNNKTKEEKESLYKKYPDGFPMVNIDKKFSSFFDKMIQISSKLVSS